MRLCFALLGSDSFSGAGGTRPDRLGEPAGGHGGTARPQHANAFLYTVSKNPSKYVLYFMIKHLCFTSMYFVIAGVMDMA